jgi:hypothetical protein
MGKSELVHLQNGDRHTLYASGEKDLDPDNPKPWGAWCAVLTGRGEKYRLARDFVGTRTMSEADPHIEVCVADLANLPDPCLLDVQAGGTKKAAYRFFVARRGTDLYKLSHQRHDEATLLLSKGVPVETILTKLFEHQDVLDGRLSVTKRLLATTP